MSVIAMFFLRALNFVDNISKVDNDMFDRVNSYRTKNNLQILQWNKNLEEAAKIQTNYQKSINQMTHDNVGDNAELTGRLRNGNYNNPKSWGENVAWSTVGKDQEVMDKWISSPPHNANLLGDFTEGAIFSDVTNDNVRYWTMTFGSRLDENNNAPTN